MLPLTTKHVNTSALQYNSTQVHSILASRISFSPSFMQVIRHHKCLNCATLGVPKLAIAHILADAAVSSHWSYAATWLLVPNILSSSP